jgi:23S rRNA (guanine745-N1)-methyltransferase
LPPGSRIVSAMLADAVPFLACPLCAAELHLADGTLRCPQSHTFDVARQGYVNLVSGKGSALPGDTAAMVAARSRFLGAGHFGPIVRAVVAAAQRALADRPTGCVVDIGAGVGHYLAPVLDALPGRIGLALDVSKFALRRAARAHPRVGAIGCDAWQGLPVRTGSAALVLSIFAPRNPAEIHRILSEDGILIVVSPTTRHLIELVWQLDLLKIEPEKQERIEAAIAPYCQLSSEDDWEFTMSLTHGDIVSAVGMGPSSWHTNVAVLHDRVRMLDDPMPVTASVIVSSYRRRGKEDR